MNKYSDEALATIRERTAKLYAKLANVNPSDELPSDDIADIMHYIKVLDNLARTEQTRRKIENLKRRKEL